MMVNEVYSKCLAMPQDSDSESVASTPEDGTARPLHTSPAIFSTNLKMEQRSLLLTFVKSLSKDLFFVLVPLSELFRVLPYEKPLGFLLEIVITGQNNPTLQDAV
ncbi:hypothetical protein J6590_004900 [Homalodisca vitripennis]|nr:hypothetical protein J6590_004900 [Homalodisca vitripennis]